MGPMLDWKIPDARWSRSVCVCVCVCVCVRACVRARVCTNNCHSHKRIQILPAVQPAGPAGLRKHGLLAPLPAVGQAQPGPARAPDVLQPEGCKLAHSRLSVSHFAVCKSTPFQALPCCSNCSQTATLLKATTDWSRSDCNSKMRWSLAASSARSWCT